MKVYKPSELVETKVCIVMKPTEMLKAKYTKRWKGKDGKWNYAYGSEDRKASSAKRSEHKKAKTKQGAETAYKGLTPAGKKFIDDLPTGSKNVILQAMGKESGSMRIYPNSAQAMINAFRNQPKVKWQSSIDVDAPDDASSYKTPVGIVSLSFGEHDSYLRVISKKRKSKGES